MGLICQVCITVTFKHIHFDFHPNLWMSTFLSFNTNHILKPLTPQSLTAYHFSAAGRFSICLCSQGEEAPVLRTCFKGVQRDGELIQVRDTVLLKSGPRKKSLPYVAKISALWEEPESGRTSNCEHTICCCCCLRTKLTCVLSRPSGELMMSLFWYYRPEHTQGGRIPGIHSEVRRKFLF